MTDPQTWKPDRTSGYARDGEWRQVLDWKDAHIVDHGGHLWIWQTGQGGGYRYTPDVYATVFYDLDEFYDG